LEFSFGSTIVTSLFKSSKLPVDGDSFAHLIYNDGL